MDATKKTMEILVATERVADQILQNKQEIVMLDKRRQSTREALREIDKSSDTKTWITIGSLLVKMSKDKAKELLRKDQVQIDIEINKLRSDQKVLVCQHRDLEHLDPVTGHDLNPLSGSEISALRANFGYKEKKINLTDVHLAEEVMSYDSVGEKLHRSNDR